METRHLRIFTTVYSTRSFTKAAEQLHTSQPTVSEHIRNLEHRLQCKLFDRLGRTILPTTEAEILYPKARAILDDLQKLEDEVALAGQTVAGELIIGASTIPGAYLLPTIASSFKKRYPGIFFEIRIDDSARIIDAILANELLLGIVGAKLHGRKVSYQPFAEDELILVGSGTSLPTSVTPKQLGKMDFIFREEGSGTRKNIESYLSEHMSGIDPLNIVATLGSSTAVKEAVKAGLGVSILSRHAMADELKTGSIKEIAIDGLPMQRTLYTASAGKRTFPHHYQVFLSYLQNSQTS